MTRPDDERCFNIGLALAGGSTRGAYSAGVMDFLLQALNEWEAARSTAARSTAARHDLPPWSVRLKTVAGTSAGGITAAVAVATICTPHTPLSNAHIDPAFEKPSHFHNNLYDLWVEQSNLHNLFDPSDLDFAAARRDGVDHICVRSVLNSSFMDIHSRLALLSPRVDAAVPRWADRLELFLTTSNLRGVPYAVDNFRANQTSSDDRTALRAHRMTRHRDWVGFKTCVSDFPGLQHLSHTTPRDPDADPAWARLRAAAMATAALPLAFPSQRVREARALYDRKHADEHPDWPAGMGPTYEYDAVDGGVFHNEPLSLVRDAMEFGQAGAGGDHGGAHGEVLHDDPARARGAMILLHPSPRRDSFCAASSIDPPGLLATLHATFGALLDDANFQEGELAQDINDDGDFSKFLIAPARSDRDRGGRGARCAIGTDALGGFGGILDREIRHHDFMLGRRNCQEFLARKFALPLADARHNPIFGDDAARFAGLRADGVAVVPIVPLCGAAAEPCALPKWPKFDAARRARIRADVSEKVECRTHQILQCFAHNMGFYKPNTFSLGVNSTWNFVVGQLVNVATARVMAKVDAKVVEALEQFS